MRFTVTITRRGIAAVALPAAVLLSVAACSGGDTADQKEKRASYEQATRKVPFPKQALNTPLERANAAEKLRRDSDPNRLSYIYLLSMDGKVISHFVAKGKVSSTDSQLLPTQEVRDVCGDGCTERMQFEAAGDDATYGAREPGIFFFTPAGQMVTWSGDYIQSDRPLSIKTPISLVAEAR
jgi:hypothetical protein